jgi:BASS family bile acid:Na+ symporter
VNLKPIVDVLVPLITFGLLLTVGADLRVDDFRRLVRQPRIVLAGLLLPLLVLPVLAVALIGAFKPAPEIATGLLLVAACPIGGLSNYYSYLARASAALSVTLTGLSCLLAIVTIPVLGAAFERALGVSLGIRAPLPLLLAQILAMLVLPVWVGMWARRRWPHAIDRWQPRLRRWGMVGLCVLLALVVVSGVGGFVAALAVTAPLAATFVVGSFVAGWIGGVLVRAAPEDGFTLAAEFATRNVAVATVLAVTFLGRIEFATFATTYILTEIPLLLVAVVAFRAGRSRSAQISPA